MKDPRRCSKGAEHEASGPSPTQCNRCARPMPPDTLVKRYLATVETAKAIRMVCMLGRPSEWDDLNDDDKDVWTGKADRVLDAYRIAMASG